MAKPDEEDDLLLGNYRTQRSVDYSRHEVRDVGQVACKHCYAQYGSARDGYTTALEIEHEETTGDYTMINADDVHDQAEEADVSLSELFPGPTWEEIIRDDNS